MGIRRLDSVCRIVCHSLRPCGDYGFRMCKGAGFCSHYLLFLYGCHIFQMKITQEQYEKIKTYLPRQRGNVSMAISNWEMRSCMLWKYVRMNCWSKNKVLRYLFEGLQRENIMKVKLEAVCLDRTDIKVYPHGTGALKKWEAKNWSFPRGTYNKTSQPSHRKRKS